MSKREILRFIEENIYDKSAEEIDQIYLKRAHEGKQFDFEFIRSFDDYIVLKHYAKALKQIINGYQTQLVILYEEYIKLLREFRNSDQSVDYLLTMRSCEICADFYVIERKTILDMIDEYRTYIFSGHFIDVIFNDEWREDEFLFDHRYEVIDGSAE